MSCVGNVGNVVIYICIPLYSDEQDMQNTVNQNFC